MRHADATTNIVKQLCEALWVASACDQLFLYNNYHLSCLRVLLYSHPPNEWFEIFFENLAIIISGYTRIPFMYSSTNTWLKTYYYTMKIWNLYSDLTLTRHISHFYFSFSLIYSCFFFFFFSLHLVNE